MYVRRKYGEKSPYAIYIIQLNEKQPKHFVYCELRVLQKSVTDFR